MRARVYNRFFTTSLFYNHSPRMVHTSMCTISNKYSFTGNKITTFILVHASTIPKFKVNIKVNDYTYQIGNNIISDIHSNDQSIKSKTQNFGNSCSFSHLLYHNDYKSRKFTLFRQNMGEYSFYFPDQIFIIAII